MRKMAVSVAFAAITIPALTGCSNPVKKTEAGTYSLSYKSYKSEEDAKKQVLIEARLECSKQGKELSVVKEEKLQKRGFIHNLEFECIDYSKKRN